MRDFSQYPESNAVHAGREDLRLHGLHIPPIDLSTTYPVDDLSQATASIDALAAGEATAAQPIYARLHNPNVARFETALARLEGAPQAVAFGSGMATLTAILLAARQDGDHVVALRPLYGGSDHLLASELLGLRVTWATPETVGDALRPETSLVIAETPTNPTLEMVDLAELVRQAGDVPLLVDSTFATPILQRPLEHGARLVMHSATKALGGHGDAIGGVVATDESWARRLRQVRIATGALLHPLAAYLFHRGLQTLPLRVERAQRSARLLADRLQRHPGVARVLYPGLDGRDPQGLLGRQMDGPGSMLSFELEGGYEAAAGVMRGVREITPAVSLGAAETLIQHPAGLTHRVVAEAAQREAGITPGLLRLSVGLEDPATLWADLEEALEAGGREPRAEELCEASL